MEYKRQIQIEGKKIGDKKLSVISLNDFLLICVIINEPFFMYLKCFSPLCIFAP